LYFGNFLLNSAYEFEQAGTIDALFISGFAAGGVGGNGLLQGASSGSFRRIKNLLKNARSQF
jgi:hypothetical protein